MRQEATAITRTVVGFQPKRRAIPAQTPAIMRP
jgi:hypothetical protein